MRFGVLADDAGLGEIFVFMQSRDVNRFLLDGVNGKCFYTLF